MKFDFIFFIAIILQSFSINKIEQTITVNIAQSELSYEIDSEAVFMIKNAAENAPKLVWTDEELDTISYAMKAKPILVLA